MMGELGWLVIVVDAHRRSAPVVDAEEAERGTILGSEQFDLDGFARRDVDWSNTGRRIDAMDVLRRQ